MSQEERDARQQVEEYRQLVLRYEALDEEIDSFLTAQGGKLDEMTADDRAHYRQMARQRDDLFNDMRALEHLLHITEDDE